MFESESPEAKTAAKIIAGVSLGYFALLTLYGAYKLQDSRDDAMKMILVGVFVYYLSFAVLAVGVVREKQAHEKILPKALAVLGLGVLPTLILLFKTIW